MIDGSDRPVKADVVQDIRRVTRLARGDADNFSAIVIKHDDLVPVVDDFIEGLKMASILSIQELGFQSLAEVEQAAAQGDDQAEIAKTVYNLMSKRVEIIGAALNAVRPEVAAIDEEISQYI